MHSMVKNTVTQTKKDFKTRSMEKTVTPEKSKVNPVTKMNSKSVYITSNQAELLNIEHQDKLTVQLTFFDETLAELHPEEQAVHKVEKQVTIYKTNAGWKFNLDKETYETHKTSDYLAVKVLENRGSE